MQHPVNEDILSFVECFHTLFRIKSSFCCIDSCIIVWVRVLTSLFTAVCTTYPGMSKDRCSRPALRAIWKLPSFSVLKSAFQSGCSRVNSYTKLYAATCSEEPHRSSCGYQLCCTDTLQSRLRRSDNQRLQKLTGLFAVSLIILIKCL